MIGNLAITDDVLEAGELIRENGGEQVFRFHSLQRRGELRAAAKSRHRERARRVPAPANREHRRVEHCLHKKLANRLGIEVMKNFFEWKRMLSSERDHNRIVSRGRLEFEIERSTKTFPQGETPSPVDPVAKRRMQNQLHPADSSKNRSITKVCCDGIAPS